MSTPANFDALDRRIEAVLLEKHICTKYSHVLVPYFDCLLAQLQEERDKLEASC